MTTDSRSAASERLRLSLGPRGLALVLALGVELLLALLLFYLWPALRRKPAPPAPTVFGVEVGDDAEAPAPTPESRPRRSRPRAAPAQAPPPPVPPPRVPVESEWPAGVIRLTAPEYRSWDVTKIESRPSAPADAGAETAGGAGDSEVLPGRGPKGEPLYAAEWHVRPTKAQLRAYISPRVRTSGWGMIACRTVADFRVEDCQEMGEAPLGSGYAGSVRQAAWQFRVRPPRVGGRALVGTWVGIRIDYTVTRE